MRFVDASLGLWVVVLGGRGIGFWILLRYRCLVIRHLNIDLWLCFDLNCVGPFVITLVKTSSESFLLNCFPEFLCNQFWTEGVFGLMVDRFLLLWYTKADSNINASSFFFQNFAWWKCKLVIDYGQLWIFPKWNRPIGLFLFLNNLAWFVHVLWG